MRKGKHVAGDKNTTWNDFSGIENPFGTPESFIDALADAATSRIAFSQPDAHASVLKRALSSTLMLPEETFIIGSSVSNMISVTAQSFEASTVGVMVPCPVEYVLAASNAGHRITRISGASSYVAPDFATATSQGNPFEAAILSNPGFPTSRLLPKRILESYLESCDWVIVDERSIELTLGGKSFASFVEDHRNLIVIQSFAEQFAMPGVPVSYLVAHPDVVAEIERFYDKSGITTLPGIFADSFSREYPKLDSVREFLASEIPWMQTMLSLVPGIDIFPAEANFVMCMLNEATSPESIGSVGDLSNRLKDRRCIIRDLSGTPGIGNDASFSVAVRTRQENLRLIEALRDILA